MSYQFVHIEVYARVAGKGKAGAHSLESIRAEAERDADATPHIDQPMRPHLLFGQDLRLTIQDATAWAETAKDARGHTLRRDGLCLLSGIVSVPRECEDTWNRYKEDTIAWAKRKYGLRLKSVLEHIDEHIPICTFM